MRSSRVDFSRVSLDRSRHSPLTVYLSCGSVKRLSAPIVQATMAQMARIEDLRVRCRCPSLMTIPFTYTDAPRLKTLAVQFDCEIDESRAGNDPTLFNAWRTPNVENLYVEGFSFWLYNPWANLRCLSVRSVRFSDLKPARLFLDLLVKVGATLEELTLSDITTRDFVFAELQNYHTEIHMPALQRVAEDRLDMNTLEMLTSRLVLGNTCVQRLRMVPSTNWDKVVHRLNCTTPERVLTRGDSTVAVHGSSAIFLEMSSSAFMRTITLIPLEKVKELWVYPVECSRYGNETIWNDVSRGMLGLEKLVIAESPHY